MTPQQAAEHWGVTSRRVQELCGKGKITGAVRFSRVWLIPKGTPKPVDGRTIAAREDNYKMQRRYQYDCEQ
jgi:hypothetical protein